MPTNFLGLATSSLNTNQPTMTSTTSSASADFVRLRAKTTGFDDRRRPSAGRGGEDERRAEELGLWPWA